MMRAPALALVALTASGCATHLSTLQTAETLEPGHVRILAGGGAAVPAAELADATRMADSYKAQLDQLQQGVGEVPDEAAQREIIGAAASLAVFPPEPVAEASVRLGLLPSLDAGLTWSSSAWRADAKWRLTPKGSAVGFALLAGAEVYTFDVSLFSLTDHLVEVTPLFQYVRFENPQRYDAEATAILSFDLFDIVQLYGAGKYRAGMYHLPVVMTVPTQDGTLTVRETLDGVMHYYGGLVGASVGLPFLKVFAEVNLGYTQSAPTVLGVRQELGGLTVYPAAGVALSL